MELRDCHDKELNDRLDAKLVEFQVDETGKCWLNIDGVCVAGVGLATRVVMEGPHVDAQHAFDFDSALPESHVKG